MVRAHVAALGGNAVVSYSMKECVFMENPNKNQVHTHILEVFTCYSPSIHESTMNYFCYPQTSGLISLPLFLL